MLVKSETCEVPLPRERCKFLEVKAERRVVRKNIETKCERTHGRRVTALEQKEVADRLDWGLGQP